MHFMVAQRIVQQKQNKFLKQTKDDLKGSFLYLYIHGKNDGNLLVLNCLE